MDAFIGEIRALPFTYVPEGWLACNGSLVSVQQYQALYAILGNTYGGTSGESFGLPDMRGLLVVGTGQMPGGFNYALSVVGGEATVTLDSQTMPPHNHTFQAATVGASNKEVTIPTISTYVSRLFAKVSAALTTGVVGHGFNSSPNVELNSNVLSVYQGGSGAHANLMPSVAIGYCIAYLGDWPSPN